MTYLQNYYKQEQNINTNETFSSSKTIVLEQHTELVAPLITLIKDNNLLDAITYFEKIKTQLDIDNLEYVTNGYSRNILSTNGGWLYLVNWDKDSITPIHGHSDFSFVYVVSGEIINIPYDKNSKSLQQPTTATMGEFFRYQGTQGSFDNAPHQIQTTQRAISLHFYSDDGKKGQVYN